MEISELLARNFLFRNLDPDVIERIAALGSTVELAGNQVLFLKGDEGDALYGVLGGRIRISSGDADGKEIILNIIDPGDIFRRDCAAGRQAAHRRRIGHGAKPALARATLRLFRVNGGRAAPDPAFDGDGL